PVRIVCNSDIDPRDVLTAAAAQQALRSHWCAGRPEHFPDSARPRFRRLYELLQRRLPHGERHLQVKVLPDSAFGLVHGKAGVVRYGDGSATSFLGSVNESRTAWTLNYELMWEDDSPEAIDWVEEEFEALWHHPHAVDLATCPFIEDDVRRLSERRVVSVGEWREADAPSPAAVAVESPVYRREQGLWPHQKYFIDLAVRRHRQGGARLLLADQVGLGKTIQLAMAAMLMGLETPGPILVLAPKSLLKQWQGELKDLLALPSARWDGSAWIDENELRYPSAGVDGLAACPRRIGIVSQGLVTRGQQRVMDILLNGRTYACVVVDEAHRARRRNLPRIDDDEKAVNEKAEPNRIMSFIRAISERTKSLLLATATPVQLHPVEAWDLLSVLARGSDSVLGHRIYQNSRWWQPARCLDAATGKISIPESGQDAWEWLRDPLPAADEDRTIALIRERLDLAADAWVAWPRDYEKIPAAVRRARIEDGEFLPTYIERHNPLLRNIVRRTRQYLEDEINEVTREPWLPKVGVKLFGETAADAVVMSPYLQDAYSEAERFTELLQHRVRSAGFFRTLLLRRLGSSLEAGRVTVSRLLQADSSDDDDVDDEVEDDSGAPPDDAALRNFTADELAALQRCLTVLQTNQAPDPKLAVVKGYLLGTGRGVTERWLDRGCVLFSQYYDTVRWFGEQLVADPAFAGIDIGLYAGSNRSGLWSGGRFARCDREVLKARVRDGTLTLLLGTDAASEGLNLQKLGTLVHIDLPWNPTRLEQRKGRIQRIGQRHDEVWVANLRYRGSVEDRVHELLSARLEAIHELFGQIPDTLEDVWVKVATGEQDEASKLIDKTVEIRRNPFDKKYSKVKEIDWETHATVLDPMGIVEEMTKGW
ncbi:MAG: helicase SNF2, partial [Chloroflexi bacterium]|nr:helicase SNF2 [Chloroflexota bacterium]